MDKLEDKEVRRAMEGRAGKRKRHTDVYEVTVRDDEGSQDGEIVADETFETVSLAGEEDSSVPKETIMHIELSSAVVGSALQRNPDGTMIAPRVRQKTEGKKVRHPPVRVCDGTSTYRL
jgi:ATP-dependent RNA helicase DHX37/DHR1